MTEQPAPVLSLTAWAEDSIKSFLTATTEEHFHAAVNAYLAPHVRVTHNGKSLTREKYIKALRTARGDLHLQPTITFKNTVSVSSDQKKPNDAGTVGLFFQVVVQSPENHITTSLNIVVETLGDSVYTDRRVVVLDQIGLQTAASS
ncbi:hypothetical protein WOLCODRAFT_152904 [Wolfiporia cocos MD-104 SS10]|uniref:SnoaL-like domain-containing protein n=1 Tax=Wolfiporia cocos (strain MD-104) TaxID=742152 RepID=A0A2H3JVB6_WOLCO|nr:hypothetical protein WOLCODRAFT_152904 [Wolfiporia cocos MD-104 SS10]